jgi:hypothetical protein
MRYKSRWNIELFFKNKDNNNNILRNKEEEMKLKKLKNLKFSFMAIVAFMAIMLITGCGDKTTVGAKSGGTGGSGAAQEVDHYDIVGKVLSDAGDPIEHVFINIIDFVMIDGGEEPFVATVRTDGNGDFGLRIPGDNAVRQVTLRFAFQDVVTYVQDVVVKANQEVDLETITLTVMSQKTIEDSTIENTLTDNVRANAYVTIGADALAYSDGTPFTTAVEVEEDEDPITATVAIGYVDTTSNPELFPDNFYSTDGGSLKLFSTYGILEIKVTTNNGNTKLNLAAGQTASISIPVGDLVNVNDPDFPTTVDLWYYDEDAADWVLEQEDGLTYDADARSFTGVVNHFSAFNAGYTFETKYAKASVIDDRGMMCPSEEYDEETGECIGGEVPHLVGLSGSTVEIFTDTFSPYGVWKAKYTAGAGGIIPDSMDPSLTELIYSDEDGDFLHVPAMGRLMAYMEYTNPTTDAPGSEGPDLIVFEEGEIKVSHDYLLSLSTSAYLEGSVEYEDGDETFPKRYFGIFPYDPESSADPTAGGIWTVKWIGITTEGKIDTFNAGVLEGNLLVNVTAETSFVVANNDFFDFASFTAGFSPAVDVYVGGNPVEKDPLYGYPIITTGKIGDVLQIRVMLPSPPGDILYTHLNGSLNLDDLPANVDPDDLWVVVEGVSNDRPVTVRAAVDADGNWPANDGTFNPVTVDGVEGYFIKVPAETDLTITVGDYVTNPLEPVIYYSYDYTSLADGLRDDEGNITEYFTDSIISAPNAHIEGQVTYNAELGKDLRIVFTKEKPGEDDTPVTVTTNGLGEFSATLEFDTEYIIEIWQDIDDFNSNRIYAAYYTSNPDGEVGYITDNPNDVVGLIQIGDEYVPPEGDLIPVIPAGSAAIVGTVLDAEGNPATGTEIWISPNGAFGPTSIAVTVGDDGTLNQLEYYMGPVLHEGFVVLDPTMAYYEIREGFATILVDVVTPGAGVVKYLSLTTGAENTESYIKGLVVDAEGNPAAGTELWISPEGAFGPTSIAVTVGDDGTLNQLEYYMGPVLHEGFVVLDPTMAYYEIREGFATILVDVVTPGAGVVETLSLATGAENTESYIQGLVFDAEGNFAAGTELWISPEGAFGPTSIAVTVGDDGKLNQLEYYMGPVLHEGFVVLDPTMAYYEIRQGFANILVDQLETPGAGVMKTISLSAD